MFAVYAVVSVCGCTDESTACISSACPVLSCVLEMKVSRIKLNYRGKKA